MRLSILTLIVLLVAATGVAAESPINLDGQWKVGDRFKLTFTLVKEDVTEIVINGMPRPPKETKVSYKLVGEVETTAVSKAGRVTGWKLDVDSFEVFDGKAVEELAIKGDVIVASVADKKASYELKATDGAKLPEKAIEALKGIIRLERDEKKEGAEEKDFISIPPGPHKVGDNWPVNADAVAKAFHAEKENVNGKVTITAEKSHEGVRCMEILSELKVLGVTAINRELPEGAALKSADIHQKHTVLTSKDGSRSVEDATIVRDMKFSLKLTLPEKPDVMIISNSTIREMTRHVMRRVK